MTSPPCCTSRRTHSSLSTRSCPTRRGPTSMSDRGGRKPVVVLTTIHGHARSRDEVAERYDAQLGGELQCVAPSTPRAKTRSRLARGSAGVVLGDVMLGDQRRPAHSPWYKDDEGRERTRLGTSAAPRPPGSRSSFPPTVTPSSRAEKRSARIRCSRHEVDDHG